MGTKVASKAAASPALATEPCLVEASFDQQRLLLEKEKKHLACLDDFSIVKNEKNQRHDIVTNFEA